MGPPVVESPEAKQHTVSAQKWWLKANQGKYYVVTSYHKGTMSMLSKSSYVVISTKYQLLLTNIWYLLPRIVAQVPRCFTKCYKPWSGIKIVSQLVVQYSQ